MCVTFDPLDGLIMILLPDDFTQVPQIPGSKKSTSSIKGMDDVHVRVSYILNFVPLLAFKT